MVFGRCIVFDCKRLALALVALACVGPTVVLQRAQAQCAITVTATEEPVRLRVIGSVQAMTRWDPDGPGPAAERLVLAGELSALNNTVVANIGTWNGQTVIPLGAGLNGRVSAVFSYQGQLYAGGRFSASGNTPLARLARWNGSAWEAVGSGVVGGGEWVNGLGEYDGKLVIMGSYTNINGQSINSICLYDGSTFQPVGSPTQFPSYANIASSIVKDGDLWVSAPTGVWKWNGTAWTNLNCGVISNVARLRMVNGEPWAVGTFPGGAAKWNGSCWDVRANAASNVLDLIGHDDDVFAVGNFTNGQNNWRLSRWNGSAWENNQSSNYGASYAVIQEFQGLVYFGGERSSIQGPVGSGFAILDRDVWVQGSGQQGNFVTQYQRKAVALGPTAVDGRYYALTMFDGNASTSAGGAFRMAGPNDSIQFGVVGATEVHTGPQSSDLWIWGDFSSPVQGVAQPARVARFDGSAWHDTTTNLIATPIQVVQYGQVTIACGPVPLLANSPACIVRWNGTAWEPFAGWSFPTYGMAVFGHQLFANLRNEGLSEWGALPVWNGTFWQPTNPPAPVGTFATISDSTVSGGKLFLTTNDAMLSWNGSIWSTALSLPSLSYDVAIGELNGRLWLQGYSLAWRINPTTFAASSVQAAPYYSSRLSLPYRWVEANGRLWFRSLRDLPNGGGRIWALLSIRETNCCDSIDFNDDGSVFDPDDIDAFLSLFSEGPCIPSAADCGDVDFNNDGSLFDPADIDSFLRVFSEGPC